MVQTSLFSYNDTSVMITHAYNIGWSKWGLQGYLQQLVRLLHGGVGASCKQPALSCSSSNSAGRQDCVGCGALFAPGRGTGTTGFSSRTAASASQEPAAQIVAGAT